MKFLELIVDASLYLLNKIKYDFGLYLYIRWKNGISMNSLVP
jgi:hypothetical protein